MRAFTAACPLVQVQHLRQMVEPFSLRRPRSLLGGTVLPRGEVRPAPCRLPFTRTALPCAAAICTNLPFRALHIVCMITPPVQHRPCPIPNPLSPTPSQSFLQSPQVRIPVELTPAQAAAYRTVLTRSYELLSDPKPSRHSGYRAAQLRNVAQELRNVCCHPALSDWAERSGGGGEGGEGEGGAGGEDASGSEGGPRLSAERLVRGSAKLAVLDTMLRQLHAAGKRVLVLAQSPKALDAVEALVRERYCGGAPGAAAAPAGGAAAALVPAAAAALTACYERVDATTKTAARQEAVARFNAAVLGGDATRWLFLQHTRSCGVGTDLPGIDAVIFLDSDWSARKDAQVRRRSLKYIGCCLCLCPGVCSGWPWMKCAGSTCAGSHAVLLALPGRCSGALSEHAALQHLAKPMLIRPSLLCICRRCRTRCVWAHQTACASTASTAPAPWRSACCSCPTACAPWTRCASRATAGALAGRAGGQAG